MDKIDRNCKPNCLVEHATEWTEHFLEERKKNSTYWYWHEYKNQKVDYLLVICLSTITKGHCSYCGKKDFEGWSIDHFKPKSKFPKLAFEWTNLFIACTACQNIKLSKYPNVSPLKPDNSDYDFDYWFEIDWTIKEGSIVPNSLRTPKEKNIAQETINWLGLNKESRRLARLDELDDFIKYQKTDPWKYSYPYFLERGKI